MFRQPTDATCTGCDGKGFIWSEGDWISVNDRLPSYGTYVLVFVPVESDRFHESESVWPAYFNACQEWRLVSGFQCHPTHWMELPSPPALSEWGATSTGSEQFADLVNAMRQAQKECFRTRSPAALEASKRLEKKVDQALSDNGQRELF